MPTVKSPSTTNIAFGSNNRKKSFKRTSRKIISEPVSPSPPQIPFDDLRVRTAQGWDVFLSHVTVVLSPSRNVQSSSSRD